MDYHGHSCLEFFYAPLESQYSLASVAFWPVVVDHAADMEFMP
jgi:hypothetical protein